MSDTHTHDGIDRRFVIHPRAREWNLPVPPPPWPQPQPKEGQTRG